METNLSQTHPVIGKTKMEIKDQDNRKEHWKESQKNILIHI
jgi:hypothetical protein